MAHTSTTLPVTGSWLADTFTRWRMQLADKARRSHAYRTTYTQLNAMTDRELADIGISRLQIAEIAEEAASAA
jgi:uncharacterized protein YjiS (DUF1127 family)